MSCTLTRRLLAPAHLRRLAPMASWPRLLSSSASPQPESRPNARCTLIPGDGVGPELMDAVREVFTASGVPVDFDTFHLSELQQGCPTAAKASLAEACRSVRQNGVCLKGVLGTPDVSRQAANDLDSLNMRFRRDLDLFAKVVCAKSHKGIQTRHEGVDMVIVRESLEGEYSAKEHESVPGVVECLKIVTEDRSRRIAKFAFDYATKHGRKKVTVVHKANIMKLGDGLFLRACLDVAELYPNIAVDDMIVDNCTMQLVSRPGQFDVLVMPNLYGDIVTNLAAGLVGSAGTVAGQSYSGELACFEPACRFTYSQATGKNVANPTGLLLAAANMLGHINLPEHGARIGKAVDAVLYSGRDKPKDIGGHATTKQFVQAVIGCMA